MENLLISPDLMITMASVIGLFILTGVVYLLKFIASRTKNTKDDEAVDKLIENLNEAKKKIKKK